MSSRWSFCSFSACAVLRMCAALFVLVAVQLVFVTPPCKADQFWDHWGDGKAEVSSYKLTIPRYGVEREGYAVLIYVTEDFSRKRQVKISHRQTGDDISVLKLNIIKKFPTGIYDYALMTSVFAPVDAWSMGAKSFPALRPIKEAFSSQEWCGVLHQQLNSAETGFRLQLHSYFEGEEDRDEIVPYRDAMGTEDGLFVAVRELVDELPDGALKLVTGAQVSRLQHGPRTLENFNVTRDDTPSVLDTALGRIDVRQFSVAANTEGHPRRYDFSVERAYPHRIIRWSIDSGSGKGPRVERAEIVASLRTPYWQQQSLEDVSLRKQLRIPTDFQVAQ